MPKLIDYAARFELIREAVCAVALHQGAVAVTTSSVAAELGVSVATLRRTVVSGAELPALGAGLTQRRRGQRAAVRGFSLYAAGPEAWQRPLARLAATLPVSEDLVEDARAWERLVGAYADVDPKIARMRAEREQALDLAVTGIVAAATGAAPAPSELEVDASDGEYERQRLRALVDGLTTAVCAGRLDCESLLPVLRRHVVALASSADERVA